MKKSAFDGEQRRNVRRRRNWAGALVQPRTAKVLIWAAQVLTEIVKLLLFLKDTFGS